MHSDIWVSNDAGNQPVADDVYVDYICVGCDIREYATNRAGDLDWRLLSNSSRITLWRLHEKSKTVNDPELGLTFGLLGADAEVVGKYFSVQETLNERGSRYGDFADNASISQSLQEVMKASPSYHKMSQLHKEGLTAIMQKIARILNGDPNYADNWHDIQGYARLVEERLPKQEE